MKQEQGFSLIEVLIAGGIMIGVVFAVQSLLSHTSKSAGDLEKRMRQRDLVEDLRFAFYDNARCLTIVRALSFQNGEEVGISLGRGEVRAGVDLPEYGLHINHLYLQNVQALPQDTFTLLLPSRQLAGQYQESGKTADLVLESQLMGSARPLKPIIVQRLTWLSRTGALTEELCYGNHDLPGRNGGGGSLGGRGEAGNAGITLYEHEPSTDPNRASGLARAEGAEPARRRPYCYISDPNLAELTGRDRLLEGETVSFQHPQGSSGRAVCDGGRLSVKGI